MSSNFFENRAVCEIIWKNTVQPGRSQVTVWRLRIAYWITKATNTHSEYAIFLVFSPQQWLRERASLLRYTYNACLVRRHFSVYITVRLNYFHAF
jgi:hypothetical protein